MSLFCLKQSGISFRIFNKRVKKQRAEEVISQIKRFGFYPKWTNIYELKGNMDWWKVCFPELVEVDAKTAWSKMPLEMKEYIKSLPEYDEKIFKEITEGE